ncbi:sugar phosphate isomerase/epimerase family protein [Modestobacter roseus]|uniref:D-psicose/D-tagatose/L-ribulose 3-epimerase n=2 Tax=Modestobacter roseus TaxID=1181884 RepID=A0A562IMZ3_9ACTN|nr:sugar phosphate isomerase/epimerase family protein [Modestobacter roseus]MQA32517.1 TIM barrel protein [Modestobacter roseus]TWH72216.1 D-psicose/D-tagatose/L-ribulose 3-epimerase [Modestobacter roseus]
MPIEVACHLNVLVPDMAEPELGRALRTLADLGYTAVVLPPIDPDSAPLGEWAAVFRDHGLTPITIAGQAPGADVSSADPVEQERGAQALRRMVEATAALGGDQMNGVSYGLFGRAPTAAPAGAFERAAAQLGAVADHAHDQGVAMTFEVLNRYETALINTAAQARDFVAASGSSHLRVHLDTFHMAVEETDMVGAVQETAPVLGYLELGQSGRGALAGGVVDVEAVVRAAIDAGYSGRVGLEAFSRSVLTAGASDLLAIWRETYTDGAALAAEAIELVRKAEAG